MLYKMLTIGVDRLRNSVGKKMKNEEIEILHLYVVRNLLLTHIILFSSSDFILLARKKNASYLKLLFVRSSTCAQ
jgi:hypothetical protein